MTYIVENNGVYGLTKGQFSATADRGSKSKRGVMNTDNSIDLAAMALQLGASFVARSFSGDKQQLVPLIRAAIAHKGAAFIDIISPCVAFNNHAGSTKSFDFVREHNEAVKPASISSPARMPIEVQYEPGTVEIVEQHDGSKLALRKLQADYEVNDRTAAQGFMQHHAAKGQIVTGLLYMEKEPATCTRIWIRWTHRSMCWTSRTSARARPRSTRSTPVCVRPPARVVLVTSNRPTLAWCGRRLWRIEQLVGESDQRHRRTGYILHRRDTDADGQARARRRARVINVRLLQGRGQFVGDGQSSGHADSGNRQTNSSPPKRATRSPGRPTTSTAAARPGEGIRHLADAAVVVVGLEMINIDHQQRNRRAGAAAAAPFAVQRIVERRRLAMPVKESVDSRCCNTRLCANWMRRLRLQRIGRQ